MKHNIRLFCVLLAILLFACSSEAFADGGRSPVEITEIMASNRSTVQAQDGSFPDWVCQTTETERRPTCFLILMSRHMAV